jgi:hypothetical protein
MRSETRWYNRSHPIDNQRHRKKTLTTFTEHPCLLAPWGAFYLIDVRGVLCQVPAFLHCGFRLMLQKDPETESVRNQQQRHNDSRKEECGSQLPRQ